MRTAGGLASGTATYRYHADGSRRQKTYNGTTTKFYYMGGLGYLDEEDTAFAADQEIAEYSGAGAVLRRYIRLPGSVDETFLMLDLSSGSAVESWAHTDRLGSVIATTDSAGAIETKYRYSPYGKPGSEGASGFPFRFTGQKLDPETGLYYYKARYYDPETGRFLQTDPIGYADQMNLYAYVGNDPVNRFDPTGEADTVPEARYMKRIESSPRAEAALKSGIGFIPVVGDIQGFAEAANDPSLVSVGAAVLSVIPIIGDVGKGALKNFTNITDHGDGLIEATFDVSGGSATVLGEVSMDGTKMLIDKAHIQGDATLKEALQAAKDFGAAHGATEVTIQGAARTTGANPGHTPRAISFSTGYATRLGDDR